MSKGPALPRGSASGGLAGRVLLLAVAALAVVQAAQLLHVHRAPSAGLYNEQHVLDALDGVGGDLPLPDAPPAPASGAIVHRCAAAAATRPSAPAAPHANPRAPPLV